MELGEFKIPGLEEFDDSPGPASGRAVVLVPEPEPLPNANTIEGVIAGAGLMASGARRKGGATRAMMSVLVLGFVLPGLAVSVALIVTLFR